MLGYFFSRNTASGIARDLDARVQKQWSVPDFFFWGGAQVKLECYAVE